MWSQKFSCVRTASRSCTDGPSPTTIRVGSVTTAKRSRQLSSRVSACSCSEAVTQGFRRRVADVAVDDPEQRDDRGLVCGDAVEIAHGRSCVPAPFGVGYHS